MLILVPFGTVAPVFEVCALTLNFLNFVDGCLVTVPSWQPAVRNVSRAWAIVWLGARGTTRGVARVGWTPADAAAISRFVAPQANAKPIVSAPVVGTVRFSWIHSELLLLN